MANPPCMIEECEIPATFTGTFFKTGQSIVVCGDHFVDFAAVTLESVTGVPVTMLITLPPETFAPVVDAELADIVEGPTGSVESSEVGTASDRPEIVVVEPEYHDASDPMDDEFTGADQTLPTE